MKNKKSELEILRLAVRDYLGHKKQFEELIEHVGSRWNLGTSERKFNEDNQKEMLWVLECLVEEDGENEKP